MRVGLASPAPFGGSGPRLADISKYRSPPPNNYRVPSSGSEGGVTKGLAEKPSSPYKSDDGSPYTRQQQQEDRGLYVRQPGSPFGKMPCEPRDVWHNSSNYKDAFKSRSAERKGDGGRGGDPSCGAGQLLSDLSALGAALDKATGGGRGREAAPAGKGRSYGESRYKPVQQASWARERLLGADELQAAAPRDADEQKKIEDSERRRALQSLSWHARPQPVVEVEAVDRLEATFRQRLGLLSSNMGSTPRAASWLFDNCDPTRAGRVVLEQFVDEMARKLNYDFNGSAEQPSSRELLTALFARYDLERSGSVPQEAFLAAAQASSAGGRAVRFIGRLREGLAAHGGGVDSLQPVAQQWAELSHGQRNFRRGCVDRAAFESALAPVLALAQLEVGAADVNALCRTFEPPASGDSGELVSFGEFVLAVRGAGMGPGRQQLVQRAYDALKREGRGQVRPQQIAEGYRAARHPGVLAGSLSEEEVAMAFLWPWELQTERVVTLDDFAERYEWVSAYIESDVMFGHMMHVLWDLA